MQIVKEEKRMVKRYTNGEEKAHIVTDQLANMYHCPDCGFEYHAQHSQEDEIGGYVCPVCTVMELEEKLHLYKSHLKAMETAPNHLVMKDLLKSAITKLQ